MHKNLQITKDALELIRPEDLALRHYCNGCGTPGVTVQFWHAGQYHTIAIHNFRSRPEPAHLAEAIGGIRVIDERKMGTYVSRKYTPGFYATARSTYPLNGSTDHWYIIARSHE